MAEPCRSTEFPAARRRWVRPDGGSARDLLGQLLPGLLGGLAVGVVLSLAAAAATGNLGRRGPELVLVAIPPGTAERIASGTSLSPIPADLRLRPGDTLVVRNDDRVAHRFGGYTIAPGTVLSLPIAVGDRGRFVCTFHPSGTLALDVAEPASPAGIATTSLVIGLPLGLLLGGLSLLLGRLEASGQGSPDTAFEVPS